MKEVIIFIFLADLNILQLLNVKVPGIIDLYCVNIFSQWLVVFNQRLDGVTNIGNILHLCGRHRFLSTSFGFYE